VRYSCVCGMSSLELGSSFVACSRRVDAAVVVVTSLSIDSHFGSPLAR